MLNDQLNTQSKHNAKNEKQFADNTRLTNYQLSKTRN